MIAYLKLLLIRRRIRRLAARMEDRIVIGSMVERAREFEGMGYE